MPRKDLTDITLVIDRSGSMESMKTDAEGGVNQFIEDQKSGEGEAVLTLVQFDTEYEFVHRAVNVKETPRYSLSPRGGTALLDAVGRAIGETELRLSKIGDENRPESVMFLIVTDGQENSSKEFNRAKVKEMITKRRELDKWEFVFLGADENSFADAKAMGVPMSNFANYTPQNVQAAYLNVSAKLRSVRGGKMSGSMDDLEAAACMAFKPADRDALKK